MLEKKVVNFIKIGCKKTFKFDQFNKSTHVSKTF